MAALLLLSLYVARPKTSLILPASVAAALAAATCCFGWLLLVPLAFAIICPGDRQRAHRIKDACIAAVVISLPMSIWLVRGSTMAPAASGRGIAVHLIGLQHAKALVRSVHDFALPVAVSGWAKALRVGMVLALAACGTLVLRRKGYFRRHRGNVRLVLPVLSALFSCAYIAFLVLLVSFVDASMPVNGRVLLPALVPISITAISLVWALSETLRNRSIRYGFVLFLMLSVTISAERTIIDAADMRENGRGYTSRHWQTSEMLSFLADKRETRRIHSNEPSLVRFVTGKDAAAVPARHHPRTRRANDRYESALRDLLAECSTGSSLVAWFDDARECRQASTWEPGRTPGWPLLRRFEDGVVYAAGTDRAPFITPPPSHGWRAFVERTGYEAPSALAFDSTNRPYLFHTREPESYGHILTLRRGNWVRLSYLDAVREAVPGFEPLRARAPFALGTLYIDQADCLYAVVPAWEGEDRARCWVLLYSSDLGESFSACLLPPGYPFLETYSGHNDLSRTPAIGITDFRTPFSSSRVTDCDLYVVFPVKQPDGLSLSAPIPVSTNCFGCSNHSGGYSFAATIGEQTHVVYGEVSKQPGNGNPTYIATIDRAEGKVTAKHLLAQASPAVPDRHATPVIAADSRGFLHVLCGSHNEPFLYLRSCQADAITGGWTHPREVGGKQTYATLVCDSRDRLHTLYRVHPKLLHRHKRTSDDDWSNPATMAYPPECHTGYTIYYQRLFADRRGALYASFTFWEENTGNEGSYPRILAVSEDFGATWQLATTEKLAERSD